MYRGLTKNPYRKAYPRICGGFGMGPKARTHTAPLPSLPPAAFPPGWALDASPLLNSSGHSSPQKNTGFLGVLVLLPEKAQRHPAAQTGTPLTFSFLSFFLFVYFFLFVFVLFIHFWCFSN